MAGTLRHTSRLGAGEPAQSSTSRSIGRKRAILSRAWAFETPKPSPQWNTSSNKATPTTIKPEPLIIIKDCHSLRTKHSNPSTHVGHSYSKDHIVFLLVLLHSSLEAHFVCPSFHYFFLKKNFFYIQYIQISVSLLDAALTFLRNGL